MYKNLWSYDISSINCTTVCIVLGVKLETLVLLVSFRANNTVTIMTKK